MLKKLIALYAVVRKDLAILWFALRDPRRPAWLLPALALVGLYLLSPIDLIPEALLVIGVVDDLVLVPLALSWLARRLPPELRAAADPETVGPHTR